MLHWLIFHFSKSFLFKFFISIYQIDQTPNKTYNTPSKCFGTPSKSFGTSQSLGNSQSSPFDQQTPSNSFGTSQQVFTTPSKSFGTTSRHSLSSQDCSGVKITPPKPATLNSPSKIFGTPQKVYVTPSKQYPSTSKSFEAASPLKTQVTPKKTAVTPHQLVHLTTQSPVKTVAEVAKKLFEGGDIKSRNYVFISPSKRTPRRAPLLKIAERSEKLEPGGLCSFWEASHGKKYLIVP